MRPILKTVVLSKSVTGCEMGFWDELTNISETVGYNDISVINSFNLHLYITMNNILPLSE